VIYKLLNRTNIKIFQILFKFDCIFFKIFFNSVHYHIIKKFKNRKIMSEKMDFIVKRKYVVRIVYEKTD